jgi:uncharacterized protein (TIGR02453 family)
LPGAAVLWQHAAMPRAATARVSKTQAASAFTGFPRKAMQFWHELAAEMNRDWFMANKQRYETEWVEPMSALLSAASARLASSYKGVKLGPPKVLRIHRDVRFSRDKAPYKTWIGAGIALGQAKPSDGVAALYVHFGLEEEFAGVGQYVFGDETLARWRKKVADKTKGAQVARLVDGLRKAKYSLAASDTLARVPRPFDADHPRAELLKMKGLVVGFPKTPRGLIHKPEYLDWLVDHAKAAAPLAVWLYKNVS